MKQFYYSMVLGSLLALSATGTPASAATLYNPLGDRSIPELIGFFIQAALGISGSIALLMVVYGGFLWLTAGGKTDRIEKGKQTLLWSVIGLAVIFGANILATFVINTLGGATAPAASS